MAQAELEGMRRMSTARVISVTDRIMTAEPLKVIAEISYEILDEENEVMSVERANLDASTEKLQGVDYKDMNLQQRHDWAAKAAAKHAKGKHGKKA